MEREGVGRKYARRGRRGKNISSLLYGSHDTDRMRATQPQRSINLECSKVLNIGQSERGLVLE
jgi:hypothetical protein